MVELKPFGEESCETELSLLRDGYEQFYYYPSFNDAALNERTFLIIGRRGSGKTSLANFFSFQKKYENAIHVPANTEDLYNDIAQTPQFVTWLNSADEPVTSSISEVWDYIFWNLIFHGYQDLSEDIKKVTFIRQKVGPDNKNIFYEVTANLVEHYLKGGKKVIDYFADRAVITAQNTALKISEDRPLFITIDSMDDYPSDNLIFMRIIAGLIKSAWKFRCDHINKDNIFLKIFLTEEIFPTLQKKYIQNAGKYIVDPVHIQWDPAELLKLACDRFQKYLSANNIVTNAPIINLKEAEPLHVLEKLWNPYFGTDVINGRKNQEKSFPYVFRHTQLRPRQLNLIGNKIVKKAKKSTTKFPIPSELICEAVREGEQELAQDVINAYKHVYIDVDEFVKEFHKAPMIFPYSHLWEIAQKAHRKWSGTFPDEQKFIDMVLDLGIIGKVRNKAIVNGVNIYEADFPYARLSEFTISDSDECSIHPMFFYELQIDLTQNINVYPFPNESRFSFIKDLYSL